MKIITAIVLSFITIIGVYAQDTIRFLHYNLLNYGVNTGYCNSSNNNPDNKDNYLKSIIKYIKPDILTVNEMSSNPAYHQRLLDNALNVDGVSYYSKSGYTNYAGSSIINMLYYNSVKFTLKSQTYIAAPIRDINVYKLYYNSSDLSTTHDTAFITCIVAHLKAGTNPSDQTDRAAMTSSLMYYLNFINADNNHVLSGDFNLYTSNEQAYQNLINFSNQVVRFNDPINKPGDWNNNSAFAPYHTQSTSTVSDCKAGGGLDDRFDFVLVSNNVKNGANHYRCLPETYWAFGNDGNHFNQNINNPVNNSVPVEIANALFGMSDHLPVLVKFYIDKTIGIPGNYNDMPIISLVFQNPVTDKLMLTINSKEKTDLTFEILTIEGQILFQSQLKGQKEEFTYEIPTGNLPKGLYFLKIIDEKNHQLTRKLIKM